MAGLGGGRKFHLTAGASTIPLNSSNEGRSIIPQTTVRAKKAQVTSKARIKVDWDDSPAADQDHYQPSHEHFGDVRENQPTHDPPDKRGDEPANADHSSASPVALHLHLEVFISHANLWPSGNDQPQPAPHSRAATKETVIELDAICESRELRAVGSGGPR